MMAVIEDPVRRGAGQHAAARARMTRAFMFVIGIEEIEETFVERLVARQMIAQHEGLKKPRGVRQMPFGRAGIRHRLHALVGIGKRCAQRLAALPGGPQAGHQPLPDQRFRRLPRHRLASHVRPLFIRRFLPARCNRHERGTAPMPSSSSKQQL